MQRFCSKNSLSYTFTFFMNKLKTLMWSGLLLTASAGQAQITVENTLTPEELVETVLVGAGVTISNVEFNHSVPLAGAVQTQAGYFNAEGTTFPISEGVLLATGNVSLAEGPNDSGSATDNSGVAVDPNDIDLDAIGTTTINDEAVLEFDFIPSGDSVVFKYIFASEEYHEFSTSTFNDVFGFFISGPGFAGPYEFGAENIAIIPGAGLPVTMNNLNNGAANAGPCINCAFLTDNTGGVDVQYDAHTIIMYARAGVECGETYHIKMAIGDAGDMSYDSGVFLEASSFASNGITIDIASVLGEDAIIEGCDSALVSFIRPEDADTIDLTVEYGIDGTAINGTDYDFLDGSVFFPIGEDTVSFWITPTDDGLTEGLETIIFTVDIVNECGDTITTTATIEVTDKLPYDVLFDDIVFDCPLDSVLLEWEIGGEGGIPEFDVTWSTGETDEDEWVPGDIVGTTTYTVDLVDQCGVESSGSVDVTLDPAPVVEITFNENLFIICPGEEIEITSTLTNVYDDDAVTYEWAPGGEITPDITATPVDEGFYYLTVFDGCNTVIDSTKIEFGGVDITDITVIDATDCPGQPMAVLGSIVVLPEDPTWSYELVGYVPVQPSGIFTDLAGGIDYILVVTDDNGCVTDTIVPVGLGENAVTFDWIEDSLRNVSCFGAMDGGAYIENIDGGITPPYDVTWTNTGGVFDEETVGVGGVSEHDDLGPGGLWTVTVTDQEGCALSHSFDLFEPQELVLDITFNNPTCFALSDGSIVVNTTGGNPGKVFEIRNEDDELVNAGGSNAANTLPQGVYTVTVTDENGCSASGSVTLVHPPQIDIDLEIDQPNCFGFPSGTAEVVEVLNPGGNPDLIEYYWTPNPAGGDGNGIGQNLVVKLGEGEYTLTVIDNNGCSRTFDFLIEYPEPLDFVEFGSTPAFCRTADFQSGNGVVFAAASGGGSNSETGGDVYDYQWTYLDDPTLTSINSTWGGRNPGLYEILITNGLGCELRDTIRLDSLNPIASFTVNSDQLNSDCQGTADVEASFTNTSQNYVDPNDPTATYRFFWDLDYVDGEIDWDVTDDFNYSPDTTYGALGDSYEVEVCLIAQNKNNCQDTACKIITIYEPIKLVNVNIFSPNGDGVNDIFSFDFYARSITTFNCVIVNRWGVQVGEINDIADGWDGTDKNGSKCTDGVYYYSYTATSDDNTTITGQGTVEIVSSNE